MNSQFREAMMNLKNVLNDPRRRLNQAESMYYPLSTWYNYNPSAISSTNKNTWRLLRNRFVRFQNQPLRTRRAAARKIQSAYRTHRAMKHTRNRAPANLVLQKAMSPRRIGYLYRTYGPNSLRHFT